MKYKGIVFFDYDGTLADESEGIYYPTEKTKEAIKELNKNGYLCVLATGRSKCYAPLDAAEFGGLVAANGAYAEIEGKEVYSRNMPVELLRELIGELDGLGLAYGAESVEIAYASDAENEEFKGMLDNFNIPRSIYTRLDKSNPPEAAKLIFAFRDMSQIDYLKKKFMGRAEIDLHRKYPSADIVESGVTKADGAAAIAEKLGISRENIYAFGDGTNDYDLLKLAGHGIAMGYHAECLEDVCEKVCGTVKNEGIYKALKEYGLI